MAIEWSRNLSTGVEWQDRHHKELFKRVNGLLDAMSVGMGKDELDRVFRFLDSYIVVHFDAEEQAMSKYDFPHAMEHLREHTGFIEAVAALRHEFATGAARAEHHGCTVLLGPRGHPGQLTRIRPQREDDLVPVC